MRWDQLEVLVETLRPHARLGRPPADTKLTAAAIWRAIDDEKLKSAELETVKDTVLENLVGGSRHMRREGRKRVLDEIKLVAAIRRALDEGKITPKELETVTDTVLENLVGGIRDRRQEARKRVLDEINNCRE